MTTGLGGILWGISLQKGIPVRLRDAVYGLQLTKNCFSNPGKSAVVRSGSGGILNVSYANIPISERTRTATETVEGVMAKLCAMRW